MVPHSYIKAFFLAGLLTVATSQSAHAAPPANDNRANATVITGTTAAVTGDNTDATREADETSYQTIWWKWTAPAHGRVTFASANSVANKLRMHVYLQGQNGAADGYIDNSTATFPTLSFPVAQGTSFLIRMGSEDQKGSYGQVVGTVNLSVNLNTSDPVASLPISNASTMSNDSFAQRITLTGNTASAVGYNYSASIEAGEPSPSGQGTFWWQYRPATNGRLTFTSTNSDNFHKRVAVYIGSSLSGLRLVEYASQSLVNFSIPVTAGTDYQISLGSADSTTSYNGSGSFVLGLSLNAESDISSLNIPVPATMINDSFAQRIALVGDTVSAVAYNASGTSEAGDPATSGYGTFWWTYRPSANGRLTITNQGSDGFKHRLGIYLGTALSNLRLVNYASGYPFSDSIPVTAGVDYVISTGSYETIGSYNTVGSIVLSLSLDKNSDISLLNLPGPATASNDNFNNRVILPGNRVSALGYNPEATREALEPAGTGQRTLWWSWVAGATGKVTLDFTGSSASVLSNGVVGIWQGTAYPLVDVPAIPGELAFNAIAGQTYQISVGSKSTNSSGAILMTIYGAPSKPIFGVENSARWVHLGNSFELSAQADVETYKWQKNGKIVTGVTGSSLVDPSAALTDAGTYRVTASNSLGSSQVDFNVGVIDMTDRTVTVGQDSTLTLVVPAVGPAPMTYRWRRNGEDLADGKTGKQNTTGTGTAKLSITFFDHNMEGTYSCRVGLANPQQPGVPLTAMSGEFDVITVLKPVVPDLEVPAAAVAQAFTWPLEASGSPSKFIVTGLPKGLTVNATTGLVSGIPSTEGRFKVRISAQNSAGTSAPREFVLLVNGLETGLAGNYTSLIERNLPVNSNLGGTLTVSVLKTGALSGSVKLGSVATAFKGQITVPMGGGSPFCNVTVPRPKTTALDLVLTFDAAPGRITGTIGIGADTVSHAGWANRWTKDNKPFAAAGTYNTVLEIPGNEAGNDGVPQGSGYFQMTVNATTGVSTIKGVTPDGVAFTHSPVLWPTLELPVFAVIQKNKASVLGTPEINLGDGPLYSNNRIAGMVTLQKTGPASTADRLYKDGYEALDLTADGSKWVKPAAKTMLFGWEDAIGNARVEFSQADIDLVSQAASLNQTFQLTTTNAAKFATLTTGNPCNVTLKVNAATGLFSGQFTLNDANPPGKPVTRRVTYSGILVSHLEEGYGWFLLPALPTSSTPSPIKAGNVWFGTP
ncbi:MAG: immunoglobulin domain-containing protein [Verrucomicrobiota bacterium]